MRFRRRGMTLLLLALGRNPRSIGSFFGALLLLADLGRCDAAADDLTPLSDEFSNASTLSNWKRVHVVEGWTADHLRVWDINATQPGRMVLEPYTSTWYRDYRGAMAFKEVAGDFVVSAEVHVDDRTPSDGNMIPTADYSLGGLMIRTPRNITNPAVDWAPGSMLDDGTNNGENYVFLSLGNGTTGGASFQFEVKTTRNSNSVLILSNTNSPTAIVQIARIGGDVITLHKLPSQPWVVHRRYDRNDFPSMLQVGVVAYSDFTHASGLSGNNPYVHNSTVIVGPPSTPDLVAGFEYVRFHRPQVPPALAGLDLGPNGPVSDAALLTFLGDAPLAPAPASGVASWTPWE